jgi:hypothetical protein
LTVASLTRAVHAPDLTVGSRIVPLGKPVLDVISFADHVEANLARLDGVAVVLLVGELNAVVGHDRVDAVILKLIAVLFMIATDKSNKRRLTTNRGTSAICFNPRARLIVQRLVSQLGHSGRRVAIVASVISPAVARVARLVCDRRSTTVTSIISVGSLAVAA